MFFHAVMESFERAKKVVVVMGAGISAESGVPTFRGGQWSLEAISGGGFGHSPRLSSSKA